LSYLSSSARESGTGGWQVCSASVVEAPAAISSKGKKLKVFIITIKVFVRSDGSENLVSHQSSQRKGFIDFFVFHQNYKMVRYVSS
jgi:hypothetical protein